ncbi:FK506-binding protein 5-like isoform X2 [Mangifera indica]|uniref:FK506-binding protein 5-like isoform X2 n=1 Tax=Mangifera indica TaxID=29780 RepID=UPI001CFC32D7|nr:FK506-binding protein 5-like isoform X2 [Mangifera indica]
MEDPYSAMEGSTEESSSEENRGKVRWILCKGLTVGRNILVTGFVMSSAPVIVPPLVVISFLGFACSVPYGLLLASYACTNKLMSILLPGSKPPPFLLDYGQVSYTDVVEDDDHGEEEDGWHRAAVDMEKEEEEMLEDTRETVAMRIELEENDNDRCIDVANHGVIRKDEIEIVEENGYEEAVEEYEDENEEEPKKLEVEVRIEGDGEEEEEEPVIVESPDHMPVDDVAAVVVDIEGDEKSGEAIEDMVAPFKVTDIVVELCKSNEVKEDEESVKETSGLLEKIREEGMADNGEKNNQSVEKLSRKAVEEHRQVNKNVEEMEMPMEGRISNNPLTKVEKNDDEDVPKADVIPKEGEVVGTTDVCSVKEEEEKPVLNKPLMLQGGGDDNVAKDVVQNVQLNREKENVTSSNADVREIADESGFDLFQNRNAVAHSYADYNTFRENEHSSSTYGNPETVDYMALPVCSGERKCNDAAICSQEDNGGVQ